MSNGWITIKDEKRGKNKHVKVSDNKAGKPSLKMKLSYADVKRRCTVRELERMAREQLKLAMDTSNVDVMLNHLTKYTGLLGEYSSFNSFLIEMQRPDATILRSKKDWEYYGYKLKEGAVPIQVLYPITGGKHYSNGEMTDYIQRLRDKGLSDEIIEQKVSERLKRDSKGAPTHVFGTGAIYDKRDIEPDPKKKQLDYHVPSNEMKAPELYSYVKELAKKHYDVSEGASEFGRGYTEAYKIAGEDKTHTHIRVTKVPGENVNTLRTLLHEVAHAHLQHLSGKGGPRGIQEAEADLTAYLVGKHFGFNFNDTGAYMKGWLMKARKLDKKEFGEDNIDRSMKTARWIIQNVNRDELETISGESKTLRDVDPLKDMQKHQTGRSLKAIPPRPKRRGKKGRTPGRKKVGGRHAGKQTTL